MIEEKSFSKEWILGLRGKEGFEKAHPEIMEKMIYALYLAEKLADSNLNLRGNMTSQNLKNLILPMQKI